jgi:hypothetical protein
VACAGCLGQYPDRAHIDFRSAIEGAQISDNPRAPRVEWVVLCENCARAAVSLLPEERDARDELQRRLSITLDDLHDVQDYATTLEEALAKRPEGPTPAAAVDTAHVANLEATVAALTERAEAAENLASRLEDTLQRRPETEPERSPRRPQAKARPQAKRRNRYEKAGA